MSAISCNRSAAHFTGVISSRPWLHTWPVESLDLLRGAVMAIMALDHVREFLHSAAASFSPEDLTRTTPATFFTRWITHFCAPVFMFAAGLGAFLWAQRGRTTGELSRFLWT